MAVPKTLSSSPPEPQKVEKGAKNDKPIGVTPIYSEAIPIQFHSLSRLFST